MEFGGPTAMALVRQAAATGRDGDGNDVLGVTEVALVHGGFDPGGSIESDQDQQRVITQPAAYFDQLVTADADDVLIVGPDLADGALVLDGDGYPVGGTAYEIQGAPAVWQSPFDGWLAGTVIRLREVTG